MRKLASIQQIAKLEPIPGADAIEKATVLGWQLVVKKGEFKEGDLCIYCEIDSLFPDKPEFEFLRQRKFRIKTIRLRGQVSQGICFPVSYLLEKGNNLVLDQDVTELMGITKWEPIIPAHLSGMIKGSFPAFVPKTDETRAQVLQPVLDKYVGIECYMTEKVDGSSATFFYRDGEFGVCSRNLELLETPDNAFWKVARELDLENKLKAHGKNIALQGELIGAGVQGNHLQLPKAKVLFFNIVDLDKYRYYDFEEFLAGCAQLGLETVPILASKFLLINSIEALVQIATAKSMLNPDVWREGIVIRPVKEVVDLQMSNLFNNGRLTFKVVNPEYLLKYE